MIGILKSLLPLAWRNRLKKHLKGRKALSSLRFAYLQDMERFAVWASPTRDFARIENRLAYVTMLYHSLEKGLSLPRPKPGFGSAKAVDLVEHLEFLIEMGQAGDIRVSAACRVLKAWSNWNIQNGNSGFNLETRINRLGDAITTSVQTLQNSRTGGVTTVKKAELENRARGDFEDLANSRHSIRCFSTDPVDLRLIRRAVRLAQTSPSLCNRQSCHVHVFENDVIGRKILELQGGNAGFGDSVNKILIVTSELGCFLSVGERNQCWIEGGMFSMTLVHALHWLGLGSCCLNWAKESAEDMTLHALVPIPDDESVVMVIVVGNLPAELQVTHSPRRNLDDVLHFSAQHISDNDTI